MRWIRSHSHEDILGESKSKVPVHNMKTYQHPHLTLALDGGKRLTSRPGRFARLKNPCTH